MEMLLPLCVVVVCIIFCYFMLPKKGASDFTSSFTDLTFFEQLGDSDDVSVVELFSTSSPQAILQFRIILDAHDIPFMSLYQSYSGLYPGVYIHGCNVVRYYVRESDYPAAVQALSGFVEECPPKVYHETRLRNILEYLIADWIVPSGGFNGNTTINADFAADTKNSEDDAE
jgi:hypothetical protein